MRALIDATALPSQRLGAGVYTWELIRALTGCAVELEVIAKSRDAQELSTLGPRIRVHSISAGSRAQRLLWGQTLLPVRVRRIAPDVFHGPHYTVPGGLLCRSVVTFHDPTFFTHPQLHERAKVVYFGRLARTGVKRATRVLAVSRYAARGAVEHAGADPDRVDVVHLGVDDERYQPQSGPDDRKLRERLGVTGPYVLWFGAVEPRKDVPTLLRAFALSRAAAGCQLVLGGPPAWGAADVDATVESTGLSDRVVRTGYVTEQEKIALYRGSSVFCYPSIAEGFGLPVLEAMACGAPVVTTTGSSPEEVGGGAVLCVPPKNVEALREAIDSVMEDEALRERLRTHGPKRAESFSWQRTAEQTLSSYLKAVS